MAFYQHARKESHQAPGVYPLPPPTTGGSRHRRESRACSHLCGRKLPFYAILGREGADSIRMLCPWCWMGKKKNTLSRKVIGCDQNGREPGADLRTWGAELLPYLLSLQGGR